MAVFPSLSQVSFASPVSWSLEFNTLIQNFGTSNERRKQKQLYVKRNPTVRALNVPLAQMKVLWEFYIARAGAFEEFVVFDRVSTSYTGEYVGVGDDSTDIWNLPSKAAQSPILYDNGIALEEGEGKDWLFDSEGGADGEDKATLAAPPAAGHYLTYDFTGYLKVRCRFMYDNLDYEAFCSALFGMNGLQMKGLLNS